MPRRHHELPPPPVAELTVGAADGCGLRLDDPSGRVSRLHALLVRDDERWRLRDLGSKNGLRLDGARRAEILVEPGAEIGIGGLTLIAESRRSVALRRYLARVLGWGSARASAVDHALRSIRLAVARRAPLILCGDGDLVPMAHSLHRHALGAERPFVLCDPGRAEGPATVRAVGNVEDGVRALTAAVGGTLCVRSRRLPADFAAVDQALRDPAVPVVLLVCAPPSYDCAPFGTAPITVPSLRERADELDRIIEECADEAVRELGALRGGFADADRAWVRAHAAGSLPEIEKATLRLVALRESRSLTSAAARLGMATVSLSRWIGRRQLPLAVAP